MQKDFVNQVRNKIKFRLNCLFGNACLYKLGKRGMGDELSLYEVSKKNIEVWLHFNIEGNERFFAVQKGCLLQMMRDISRHRFKELNRNGEILGYCYKWNFGQETYICISFQHHTIQWMKRKLNGVVYHEWINTLAHEIAHIFVSGHDLPFPSVNEEILKFMLLKGKEKKHLGRKRSFYIGFEVDFWDIDAFASLFDGFHWKACFSVKKETGFLTATGSVKKLPVLLKRIESFDKLVLFPYGENFLILPKKK